MEVRDVLPRDAIRSVDDPAFGPDYFGDPDDEVVVVDSAERRSATSRAAEPRADGDPPRAYPIRVLSYHEIVNDATGGRPVAVTWCPICWSAAVYEPTVDGRTLSFGVSGKLADDALVMYDRETGSEWRQTTGECIAGELEGTRLTVLPATTTTWAQFRASHSDGQVLQPVRGGVGPGQRSPRVEYDMAPYRQYVERAGFGLHAMRGTGEPREWDRTDLLAKTVVLGVESEGAAVGYPRPRIEDAGGLVADTVGTLDVVVLATDGELYAFEDPGFDLAVTDDGLVGGGTTWDPVTGEGDDGRRLARVPARTLFAFAWQDAHGPDSFYSPDDDA